MDEPVIRIHDLGLAAALVSHDFKLHATDRDQNGRLYFIFRQTDNLTQDIDAYWADTLVVKARTYSDNIKMLKSRIYGER
ncbi:MAG TPA: DUF5659 domain-containing protein [Candidatus Saccharimonadales bacterium]|nr:DUF5659 domain-containing protein [Candidatus Saccharimonadales bacterium]